MKEYKFISVASTPLNKQLRQMFDRLDINQSNSNLESLGSSFYVRLRNDDPRLPRLIEALDNLPLDPPYGLRREVEYERKDLEPCEFVDLHINRAPKGDTGPLYNTQYDLSTGCPECGTGAVQTSPLRIKRSALPKKARAMCTYNSELLIDNELATDLMVELGSERGLRQVEDLKTHDLLPWWQILPDTSMPPAEPETGFRQGEEQCPRCKRDGFFGPADAGPLEYIYRLNKIERSKLPDFVHTWEHGGYSLIKWRPGHTIRFAAPGILISNRAMRVFWAKKIREAQFTPVRFI